MTKLIDADAGKKLSTPAYVGRWICVPFAAALGFVAATVMGWFLTTSNQWMVGATDESGYIWLATKIGIPFLQGAGFVFGGVSCAPSHHHETRVVLITLPLAIILIGFAIALYRLDFDRLTFTFVLSCAATAWGLFFGGRIGVDEAK